MLIYSTASESNPSIAPFSPDSTAPYETGRKTRPHHLRLVSAVGVVREASIAVVDDDEATSLYLSEFFSSKGYQVTTFARADEFLAHVGERTECPEGSARAFPFDIVFSDVRMPGINGLQLTKLVHEAHPDIPIVLMTAYSDVQDAVSGMKEGAYDYVEKPFTLERIDLIVRNALWLRHIQSQKSSSEATSKDRRIFGAICTSPAMRVVYDLVAMAARSDGAVLVTGEEGVGKAWIARAIHENGGRAARPFVRVVPTAIPSDFRSLFAEAGGGTIFLQDVGDLDAATQERLARALSHIGSDVRVIASTAKNLEQEVRLQNFREDLYYALSVIPIHVPPLRQRTEDIAILASYFLNQAAAAQGKQVEGFEDPALAKLQGLHLAENVDELSSIVEAAVAVAREARVGVDDLGY